MANAIFIVFDDSYLNYARACLNSIRANYPDHPEVVLYYSGQDPETIQLIESSPNVHLADSRELLELVEVFDGLPAGPTNSMMVYYKFLIWGEYFSEWDKVLYLDVDTLILNPLDELFDKTGFYITPNNNPNRNCRVFRENTIDDLDLRDELSNFSLVFPDDMNDMANAGVFMAPRALRTQQRFSEIVDLALRFSKHCAFADQSILSLWCAMKGIEFDTDYRFNFQFDFQRQKDVGISWREASIIHFAGVKPDDQRFLHIDIDSSELKTLYDHYESGNVDLS